ncbi:MAG: hypothetical protein ABR549_14585 [Mycobacteriales bacterium]
MTAVTWSAFGGSDGRSRRKPVLILVSILVAGAMLALYTLQAATPSAQSPGGAFGDRYRKELNSFRSATAALQEEGQQALGKGVTQVLPVYQHLREATLSAVDDFAKLKPPSAAKADYKRFIQLLQQQAATLQVVVTAVKTNQTRQLGASLQHYAVLVSDWLTIRQRVDAHLR